VEYLLQSNPSSPEETREIIGKARGEIESFVKSSLKKRGCVLSEEDMEDLVSACWIQVYSKIPDWYRPNLSKLETGIYTTVHRVINRYLNKITTRKNLVNDYMQAINIADSYEDDNYSSSFLEEELEKNCVIDGSLVQQILYHRVKEDKTWQDISAITGVSVQSAINIAETWCENVLEKV